LFRLDVADLRNQRAQLTFRFEVERGDELDRLIDGLQDVTRALIALGSSPN
jgi:hypothetical protein